MLKIESVDKGLVGSELNLKKGDIITHFNGQNVEDILDYEYFDGQENFEMTVKLVSGEVVTFDIEKDPEETLGLGFDDSCCLTARACRNKCIFCFVDQLPKGMRKSLYFKDDDWRLSFVSGNYVTFTNLTEGEIKRIKEKKFSPLYVSVHATNDEVRRDMLKNPSALPIMPLLRSFAESGIVMHTQIVLCPNVNDKEVLEQSLFDLFSLHPFVNSVAIVPVGMTQHRAKLLQLSAVDKESAFEVIGQVESFSKKCFEKIESHFVYCSDEFYVKAEIQTPCTEFYEDFSQIENGVGLLTKFQSEFDDSIDEFSSAKNGGFTIVTGESAYAFISKLVERLKKKFTLDCNVVMVENKFFGSSITVCGLLTATDILKKFEECDVKQTVLIPRTMLRETEDVFLDGISLSEFVEQSKRKVEVVDNDGYDFCNHLLKGEHNV